LFLSQKAASKDAAFRCFRGSTKCVTVFVNGLKALSHRKSHARKRGAIEQGRGFLLPKSLLDSPIFSSKIPISLDDLPISLEEIHKSAGKICISPKDLPISLLEIRKPKGDSCSVFGEQLQ